MHKYIYHKRILIFKPQKELREFTKVELDIGEEKQVEIILNKKDFEYFNPETNKWSLEQGKYKILVGKSSKDIVLEKEIFIEAKDKNVEKNYSQNYYTGNVQKIKDEEFEKTTTQKIKRFGKNVENNK